VRLRDLINLKLRDDDNEFTHCGTITIEENQFTPSITNDLRGAGVYLWVAKRDDSYEILYVGKAKDGPKSRLSQHKGGINKNTTTAGARRTQILECIPNRGSLEVFFRASPTMNFRGVNNVSTYSLDEEAFIVRFSPPLNRSKPPVVEVDEPESFIEAMTDTFDFSNESQWSAWIHHLNSLSPERKNSLGQALRKTRDLVGDEWTSLDMGVTGSYSLGQFCQGMSNRPFLVFGRFLKKRFAPQSKFALLALDEGKQNNVGKYEPDILFFGLKQESAFCYRYEEFVHLDRLPKEVMEQLSQVLSI
jgi:hypothetical protein